MGEPLDSGQRWVGVRAMADSALTSIMVAVSSYVFMTHVKFLPGEPVIPALISILLGFTAFRTPGYSDIFLALIVFSSISWQFLGFTIPPSASTANVNWQILWFSAAFILLILALNTASAIFEPLAVSSAALASALLLTEYYYLAPLFLVMPSLIKGVRSIYPTAYSFIATSLPLIILENALRGERSIPVIFSHLDRLASSIRPSIPSFNVFITGLPSDIIYPGWRDVLSYLGGGVLVLIIPLICLSISFILSATIARIVLWFFDRLPYLENREAIKMIARPPIVAITSSITFSLVLVLLSPRNVGGYITGYGDNPDHILYLLAGGLAIGALFSARKVILNRLETIEGVRRRLGEAIERADSISKSIETRLELVSAKAPSIDVDSERRLLEEVRAALSDARKRLAIGKYSMLEEALKRFTESYLPRLGDASQRLGGRVVEEIMRIDSACKKGNYILANCGVKSISLPQAPELPGYIEDLESLLNIYSEYISRVRGAVSSIYSLYVRSISSINKLLGSDVISLPPDQVNPISLMNSGDYVEAIELVTDLWRSFQENLGERLRLSCSQLLDALSRLDGVVRPEGQAVFRDIVRSIGDSCTGVGSIASLEDSIERLRSFAVGEVEKAIKDLDRINRVGALLEKLDPVAAKGLELRTPRMAGDLSRALEALSRGSQSIPSMVAALTSTREILWSYTVSLREDESKILILSQYPLARSVLDSIIKARGSAHIEELPFTPSASEIYARIYSRSAKNVEYNEEEAVIRVASM